ncbi:Nuclear export mediator factor NEMF-like protein [Nymphaea thermarum]|nr:Nuclear export mediator factor NEMF-like protein [Nymphaea thermarum]
MVKVRMNTADVAAEVKCLRRHIGMRCANVYDLNPKTYMFKLINSSGVTESGESEKVLLLMESGVRLHTTAYVRDKNTTPSGFTLKLRKHIRGRRLEDVRQLGYDRIILFQFGLGTNAYFIILELYAQGNILLTDPDFVVMTLLRSHRDDDKGLAIMSRHRYPVESCRVFERTSPTKLEATLMRSEKDERDSNRSFGTEVGSVNVQNSELQSQQEGVTISGKRSTSNKKENDGEQGKKMTLKAILGDSLGYGPALCEHIILDAGLVPNMKIGRASDNTFSQDALHALAAAVGKFEDWLEDVISGAKLPEGYILMQKMPSGKKEALLPMEISTNKVYDEFSPILLNQFKSREFVRMDTFDAVLDEFYSKIESQRADQQQRAREESAVQKLTKIQLDQENRVHALKKEVDHSLTMAELIEYNLQDVEAAIMAVRVALANGMDWEDLARMVKEEKKSGNPVAGLIDKLHLERNCVTLLLSNNLDEMDDDERTDPAYKVEVDLSLSAHANACRWFEMKKRQENKQKKTITSHAKAFKAAERKTKQQLAQEKTVAAISHMRKVHWFEKFNWFISSENYLIISGRDAQQNEMVVKRYMSKGDIYVHADLHGASSTVIKNHTPDLAIPPLTLNQAGCFTVCHSQAWEAKMVTSAWWVYPHQVSKTAPTGEYLTVGSFMIRGKKNFLPPHPLVMGFGLLFRLDESSLGSHLNERRIRGEEEGLQETEDIETVEDEVDSLSGEDIEDVVCRADDQITATKNNSEPIIDANSGKGDVPPIPLLASAPPAALGFAVPDVPKQILPELEVVFDRTLALGPVKVLVNEHVEESLQDDVSKQYDPEKKVATPRDKAYISKAERRKLKKAEKGSLTTGQHESKEGDVLDRHVGNQKLAPQKEDKGEGSQKSAGGKVARGQKGKLKKIKEKYSEQDEEERIIRMALLAETTEEKEKLNDLDYFTGCPLANDVLLYAVPVCGPYSAVQSYKYRVKITPGTAKRGKAAKTAINLFVHMQDVTTREKELIKACTDPELVAAIIGNAKITAAGLTRLKKKQKGKKSSKKEDL